MKVESFEREKVGEQTTARYTNRFYDEAGDPLADTDLNALTLTIYEEAGGTIINGVNDTNILNVGRGVVDAQGNLTITLEPADNQVVNSAREDEVHAMLIKWTYNTTSKGAHLVRFPVRNLRG